MKLMTLAAAALGLAAAAPAPAAAAEPVKVMVVGTWHFDNPGLDLNNVKADDVLKPRRQRELAAVAEALAAFRPTKIMVERVAGDLIDPKYPAFTSADLASQRDERVQIAYRLAHRLRFERVYAIDEQTGEGDPDYFPFGKVAAFAEANGQKARIESLMAKGAAVTRTTEEKLAAMSIPALMAEYNDDKGFQGGIGVYYELLGIGDAAQQPGAELNAYWYMRNAKIFAKLRTLAEPGDRILVVYGAGHNYWLRHFARETSGFESVDPIPLLQEAAKTLER